MLDHWIIGWVFMIGGGVAGYKVGLLRNSDEPRWDVFKGVIWGILALMALSAVRTLARFFF